MEDRQAAEKGVGSLHRQYTQIYFNHLDNGLFCEGSDEQCCNQPSATD